MLNDLSKVTQLVSDRASSQAKAFELNPLLFPMSKKICLFGMRVREISHLLQEEAGGGSPAGRSCGLLSFYLS